MNITLAIMKTIIERGASWTLEETKLLLSLWGQDLVQRQATCQKRTKEVYEKISEKFNQSGYERTPDQVRTRVFNMIAEYRRILRDPSPERMKKCIFFEALHRIYQAKHMDDVKSALDDYEPECPYSPSSNTISSERGDESVSDTEAMDETLIINNRGSNEAATNISTNSTKKNNASATSDLVNDSINNNNDNSNAAQSSNKQAASSDKDGSATNQLTKKIKLESPKPGSSNAAAAAAAAAADANDAPSATKHKSSSSAANANLNATSSASTNNISGSRHQSLLLPQATSASVSTPINKATTSAGGNSTPAYINVSSSLKNVMGATRLIGHANGSETVNLNGTPTANRLPTTAAITSHQFYQAPVNTFDVTSSALLIDRMFAHLSRESENMREWIALEKDRIALERARRVQETERDCRRERVLIDTLMKFQEQWIAFISKLEPRLIEKHADQMPTLNIPPKESFQEAEQQGTHKVATQTSPSATNTSTGAASSSTTTTNSTSTSSSINNNTSMSSSGTADLLSSSSATQSSATGSVGGAPEAVASQ